MSKVNREQAEKYVTEWLDHKHISQKKREQFQDHVDALVDAVEEGIMVIKDDKVIVQTLNFPIMDNSRATLEFKPRLEVRQMKKRLQSIKASDGDGRIEAYVCELTGLSSGVIGMMDSVDYNISTNVAVFFL